MNSRVVVVALGIAPLLAPFAGCADDFVAADADAAADAIVDAPIRPDRTMTNEEVETGPEFNADGWIRLDFSGGCGLFYAAPTREKMPAPTAWEPCEPDLLAKGWTCSRMKEDWPPSPLS